MIKNSCISKENQVLFPALLTLPLLWLLLLLALCACQGPGGEQADLEVCRVVLEEGEGYLARSYIQETRRGGSAVFLLSEAEGYTVTGSDRPEAVLTRGQEGLTLRLENVRYTQRVHLSVQRSDTAVRYHANGGGRLDGGDPEEAVELPVTPSHLRLNTDTGQSLFSRAGFTLARWNTAPDGSGLDVGLGSRVSVEPGMILYAQWRAWTPAEQFSWERSGEGAVVTAWLGEAEEVVVPGELDGLRVVGIAPGAFRGAACRSVILPPSLRRIEDGAFQDARLSELCLFDNLQSVSDYAFSGCEDLATLRINALEAPRYSGSYYASFADKFDRLRSLRGERKLVLFSGSSTRFGYDSALLEEELEGYKVVNMGVFAYSNALPQLLLLRTQMEAGDILLHAPEFDAAQRQFCTTSNLDAAFFCMLEADYDLLGLLDLRQFGQVFTALHSFLAARQALPPRSYARSPAEFDEEGDPVDTPSYNAYGDYILYRPNAAEDTPVYGLPVRYTPDAYPLDSYLRPYNEVCQSFQALGIRFYFTYAPRNRLAISEDSTPQARSALERYLRTQLAAPVISRLEDSLFSGVYLSGTDNHLSSQGVQLRTRQVLSDLRWQLDREARDG